MKKAYTPTLEINVNDYLRINSNIDEGYTQTITLKKAK